MADKDSKQVVDSGPAGFWASEYPRPKHPWKPGPIISEPDPVNKALPTGIVRAIPSAKNGRAFLELRNDTDTKVEINNALAQFEMGKVMQGPDLLPDRILLKSEKSCRVDVTERLRAGIQSGCRSLSGSFSFRIWLVLEPEPRLQPAPASYRAVMKDGYFEDFSPDRGR